MLAVHQSFEEAGSTRVCLGPRESLKPQRYSEHVERLDHSIVILVIGRGFRLCGLYLGLIWHRCMCVYEVTTDQWVTKGVLKNV